MRDHWFLLGAPLAAAAVLGLAVWVRYETRSGPCPPRPARSAPGLETPLLTPSPEVRRPQVPHRDHAEGQAAMEGGGIEGRIDSSSRWHEALTTGDVETLERLAADPGTEGIDELVRVALAAGSDPLLRVQALDWLAKLDEPRVVHRLLDIAENPEVEEYVRVEALSASGRAMGIHPSERSAGVPRATAFLREPSVELRCASLECLGEARDASCQTLLRASLDDPEAKVRAGAARVAGQIEAHGLASIILDRAREEVESAEFVEALGALRVREAVPYLSDLASATGGTQVQAIEALGRIGDDRAVALLGTLARGDDWILVEAAREALSRIGTPGAAAELERVAESTWGTGGESAE